MVLSAVPHRDEHVPERPAGLSPAGIALWSDLVDELELDPHEFALLAHAARVESTVERLEAIVASEGYTVAGKVHPAIVEARQQRVLLSRLLVTLRIPPKDGDGDSPVSGRPQQRGGVRGAYGPRPMGRES